MNTIFTLEDAHKYYKQKGWVLFETGVLESWILELFAEYLGSVRGIWGKEYEVDFDPSRELALNSVSQSSSILPPHTDGTFEIELPRSLLLQCVKSDKPQFGTTILVDGWAVIDRLDKLSRQVLLETPFRFYRSEKGKEVTLFASILEQSEHGYILRYRNDKKHPLVPPTKDASVALAQLVDIINSPDVRTVFDMKPGDILWLNNHRLIHGRTGLSGTEARRMRRYWIQFS